MASTVPAAVVARGWGWRHAGRRDFAVRGLDLAIAPGERVLLLGASGAGKSTLLQGIAGLLGGEDEGEEEGSLLLDGRPATGQRGRAGLVLQDPEAGIVLARVGDDVAFGCENLGVPPGEIWPRVGEALDGVGLRLPLDAATSTLSGGQKQRLALAGVLAMRPGIVLLDEPTANLDPVGVREVREAVERLLDRTGATLVVVEHRTAVWADLVDRVVVLAPGGGVAAAGPPSLLQRDADRLAADGVWIPGRAIDLPTWHPTPGGPLLTGEELTVGRGGAALAEVGRIGVRESSALAVTGPNGAGKTTLGLTLAGLLPPVGGSLRAGERLAAGRGPEPIRWRSRDLLSRIGTVFQEPEHQFLAADVAAELAVGPRALGLPQGEIDARVDELLERLGLVRLAAANPFTLSGGEKRRLSVGTALATRPAVLVLDEPTFGQDARTWRELVLLLRSLVDDGTGVVAVTHDEAFAEALATATLALPSRTVAVPA
ncbi:MAG: transporter ATP-binding protein [Microbacteriaceae bacterium]|jgi:energy-coupling factor transporter ATP-binding protein EcfA2|uniref:ABC transporter ATP-binding protein n=1 Tax=Naasia sp. TaxID=2546198 RepID=UPI002631A182|nr:ABC transporter ATP-binding protein [Naasia sp.]MCU1569697.1 transporter ATP-binding protein [Naasia sp.]MCU1638670.1 transporter ATP-binding protein [Microbacteriaceae bacterium]